MRRCPAAVAATLGVQLQPGSTMTESIVGWLGARPTLLIMDNCEHVLDDVADPGGGHRGGRAGRRRCSRPAANRWDWPGEVVRRVPSLDPATDAVQLFAERAATAADGFVHRRVEPEVIAGDLCPIGRDPVGHRTGRGPSAGLDPERDPGPFG